MMDRPQSIEWTTTPLSEVTDFQNGYAFKSSTYRENGAFVIRIGNVQADGISLNNPAYVDPPDLGAENFLLCEGDMLISLTGNVGRIAIIRQEHLPAVLNQRVARISPAMSIEKDFLFHLMRSEQVQRKIFESAKGAAQLNVSTKDLSRIEVPLPPLAEQKVIADKLDTLLAQVENTKARLERIPKILKRFRQSVLAAAVSGQLTKEWRSGAEFKIESGELSRFVSIDIGHAFKSKEFANQGVPLLRGQNIEPGALRWNETKYFSETKLSDFRHLFIKAGDIVLAMDRPIISSGLKIARAKPSDLPCVLVQRVARFEGYNSLSPDYLYVLLQNNSFYNYIKPNQTGSDIPHISGKQILAYPVGIPDIEEQIEIVHRVDQLFAHADRIEQQVNNALARVNNLTQSILAKAFRGELTEQWRKDNPELISEGNSAEALLKRIKTERDVLGKKTRSKISGSKKKTDRNMKTTTREELIGYIESIPAPQFSFNEIVSAFEGDYEKLKECFFALLSDNQPVIEQRFDSNAGKVVFIKVEK